MQITNTNEVIGEKALPIGEEQVKKFTEILRKYDAGKAKTKTRIKASEDWWKLRNASDSAEVGKLSKFKSRSGWLHNVITSKHADAVEAYPEANILPREAGDRAEATKLSAIIPCVLEHNAFERVYSDAMWQKFKTGTGAYKVFWDAMKLNGLGDIGIERVNLLDLYWEPGVCDIQKSKYFFHTELCDREIIEARYPETAERLKGNTFVSAKFLYDENVDVADKVTVIDVYYHRYVGAKKVLHYCKYVNDIVLYATENIPELAERGLYDHGMYPYFFDPLFPIEGSPCGYGFVDLCQNPQAEIDILKTCFVKNAVFGSLPRYLSNITGDINEDELLDLEKIIIHTPNSVNEANLRVMDHASLDGNYIQMLNGTIDELRQTSGNTEAATGAGVSGVTSASGLAALQEASGKGSRDATKSAYRVFSSMCEMVIELIRQFYDMPRQFRIIGERGAEMFVKYDNSGLQPVYQGNDFGRDMGYRKPVFDVKVSAQKKNVYSKLSQNELALQFFKLGFFNPQIVDQALLCLDIMDFDGKDEIIGKVSKNGTIYQKLIQYMRLSYALAMVARPDVAQQIGMDMASVGATAPNVPMSASAEITESGSLGEFNQGEHPFVEKAREQSAQASQPA